MVFFLIFAKIISRLKIYNKKDRCSASLEVLFKDEIMSYKVIMFHAFLELVSNNRCLLESEVNVAKRDFRRIETEPESYRLELVARGCINRTDFDVSNNYLFYHLLKDYMFLLKENSWSFDLEQLIKFISEEINLSFEMLNKESVNTPKKLLEKLETCSSYTLLSIAVKMDIFHFFLCKKKDKKRLIELARNLCFPVSEL